MEREWKIVTRAGLHITFAVVWDMTLYVMVYNYRLLEAFATSIFRIMLEF